MYILEGNIGAGKSTFLKMIAQQMLDVSVALEPLHNWQSAVYGQSLLSNFYQNPQRWAYTMETLAMMCRVHEHLKDQASDNQQLIVERSIYSGHYCFAMNGYANGFMTDIEWQMYTALFNFLIPNHCLAPQGFIYLQVDPQVAHTRIKKRNRLAEKDITLSYLKDIEACHAQFLINKQAVLPELVDIPVLILDCNQEFEQDSVKFKEHCEQISLFMATTQAPKNFTQSPRVEL